MDNICFYLNFGYFQLKKKETVLGKCIYCTLYYIDARYSLYVLLA